MADREIEITLEVTRARGSLPKGDYHILVGGPVPERLPMKTETEKEVKLQRHVGTAKVSAKEQYAIIWSIKDNSGSGYKISLKAKSGTLKMKSANPITDRISMNGTLAVGTRYFFVE